MHQFKQWARLFALLAFSTGILSCVTGPAETRSLVLEYYDFGPQAMAWPLLGNAWWQWQAHGDSQPREYPIRVVVYRDVDQHVISDEYPVSEERLKDYRYLSYDAAIEYLDTSIEEDAIPALTEQLVQTREKIIDVLGNRTAVQAQ